MIPFAKGHGLGNDYIVINGADLPAALTPPQIEKICDRNWGVGSDGILLLVPAWAGADFGLRIFNPDGSEAEKSGNGLRIFAKYLHDHGHARRPTFTVDTMGGRVECQCHVKDGRVNEVTVEMGRCTFVAPEIPMNGPEREVVKVPLQVADRTLIVTAVSVGNPHCVVFTDRLDEALVRRLGPLIEHHPAFPEPHQCPVRARRLARPGGHPHLGARGGLDAGLGLVVQRGGLRGGEERALRSRPGHGAHARRHAPYRRAPGLVHPPPGSGGGGVHGHAVP